VVRFLSAPGSRHLSCLIRTARDRQQDILANHYHEHHSVIPEVIHLSEDTVASSILIPRALFPRRLLSLQVRHPQQSASSIQFS